MKVVAALSGGVDSALAAAIAVEQGHEVVGVHMALSRNPAAERTGSRGCCSIEDASDARRAADVLGIPFYVWDLSERFEETVMADFLSEYAAGRTPNPCVRCNEHVKFATLLDRALALGFDGVVTGHWARLTSASDGSAVLARSANVEKDQSYVLAVSGPQRLARAVFPLGEYTDKAIVRREAAARGLPVAAKPDSYDICFVADGDTRGFLRDRLGGEPGQIVTADGAVVGSHDGAVGFTVGQRRGLHLDRPAPDGRPRYVLRIEPVANRVVVGAADDLDVTTISAGDAVWFATPTDEAADCAVQVRAHGAGLPGRVRAVDGGIEIDVPGGVRAVAAGQSVVCYRGDDVLVQATVR